MKSWKQINETGAIRQRDPNVTILEGRVRGKKRMCSGTSRRKTVGKSNKWADLKKDQNRDQNF